MRTLIQSSCLIFLLSISLASAEVTRVEITSRQSINDAGSGVSYELIEGVLHYALDPNHPANRAITDIEFAPLNSAGLVEFSADFRLYVPPADQANGGLLYNVNNRGRNSGSSALPLEISLQHPLSQKGFTYLITGWINELTNEDNLRLHAPIVRDGRAAITGPVRYEWSVSRPAQTVAVNGGRHLGYQPTADGMENASLTHRLYAEDVRIPIERSEFSLNVEQAADSNQPAVSVTLNSGFQPGHLYELIYEAQDPVLAGAGMAGVRDIVSLIRHEATSSDILEELNLPEIDNTVAWGSSQSGRFLRTFVYDGFNADLNGAKVFDGVVPFIAGSGMGMFNNRFAMPTRTNQQHANHLYPNDLFPFTYGESYDPFTRQRDGILAKARASDTVPKVMHIQTTNEYWLRGGSLPHTNPQGTEDAEIPSEVRFYTIGGSQHGSGDGIPDAPTTTQLMRNPNMWLPIAHSLVAAMYDWVANDQQPPASRYPKIADGSLVPSHTDGDINYDAWNKLNGVEYPESIYHPPYANYGARWQRDPIIDQHPTVADQHYTSLVPAIDADNNDLAASTILPPLTRVPLATFVSWNLRAPSVGAEKAMASLAGGYIPFARDLDAVIANNDTRSSIGGLYSSFDDYLEKYEAATDELIAEGYLLPEFKGDYMAIARQNENLFQ
ncbi:MAG: hypothetical protein MI746_05830 [Pseudomonadales bacterium]|nr:hypothetical protein [Pseudomonadales bacterium]